MENPIVVFDSITSLEENKSRIYVTDSAKGYFAEIEDILDVIAQCLTEEITGSRAIAPLGIEVYSQIKDNINRMKTFLQTANKNSRDSVDKICDVKNVMVKFNFIKDLMQHSNAELREMGCQLFIRAPHLYTNVETREFVSLLDESQIENIIRIRAATRTAINKELPNPSLDYYINERKNMSHKKYSNGVSYEEDGR